MSEIERLFTAVPVEVRGGDKHTIGGYAAVFNRESENLGGFVERLAPSVFNETRGRGWPNVMARYNHNDDFLLGNSDSGTLRLSVDDTGLIYEVDVPNALPLVYELVQRGDVRKSSFAFRTYEDDWDHSGQDYPRRTVLSAQLVDVAPVNMPAYHDTSVGLRSLAEKFDADYEEVRKLAEANELRKFFVRTDGGPAPKRETFGPAALAELMSRESPPA